MPEDLPIHSESMLRTRLQFADLERLKRFATTPVWKKSDAFIERFEGGANVRRAREGVQEVTNAGLLQIHSIVFDGKLRPRAIQPLFRGQDCPDPEFIDRSLANPSIFRSAENLPHIPSTNPQAQKLKFIPDLCYIDAR